MFDAIHAELAPNAAPHTRALRAAISAAHRRDESECVQYLRQVKTMQDAHIDMVGADAEIAKRAHHLVTAVRSQRTSVSGVDALMQEFSLSSDEGVALMCLAEALLRIPDHGTADRLIADKIGKGNWRRHLGGSPSLFVNAATWGLVVTGTLVATHDVGRLGNALTQLIKRGGEPLVRRGVNLAMRMLGDQFVAGQTIDAALANSRSCSARGYQHSYDMLGEAALTTADAQRYFAAYEAAIHAIGTCAAGRGIHHAPGISVKLSALHPRYGRAQQARVLAELLPRLQHLVRLAQHYAIGINIDAEEADRLELSFTLLEALVSTPELAGFDGIGFVVQAYQKRAPFVIDYLVDLALRSHRRFMVRLVKGAYWDSEIKRAQVDGMADYPVYTRKHHTDMSYLVCARKLLAQASVLYPQFATHNAHTVAAVQVWARRSDVSNYEFQCLHGMGESLYDEVLGDTTLGAHCRIYAPVGPHRTLLAYLVRRLLENGANNSFVNQLVNPAVSTATLITDPFAIDAHAPASAHFVIQRPDALFAPSRINSSGLDLSDELVLNTLALNLQQYATRRWDIAPMLAVAESNEATAIDAPASTDGGAAEMEVNTCTVTSIRNPALHSDLVGTSQNVTMQEISLALTAATAFAPAWQDASAHQRSAALVRAAALLETHRPELLALLVREAGKTLANAAAEIREAVDFLRYYAAQAAMGSGRGLGLVACISPWNFPLAIFIGQVGAALAAGNVVVAKPAEQTPLIAGRAVALLHQAGIPHAALQLLPGPGDTVGAALVADDRVQAVLFTGSTDVAQLINRVLAKRGAQAGCEIALVAETGGQNVMIVDSSALPEQVIQDVLSSAFDSAGQRCSALRVLCVQAEIADEVLAMLDGAMAELCIGVPDRLAVDIGPVIDAPAQQRLQAHIQAMRACGFPIRQPSLSAAQAAVLAAGTFVLPTIIEIPSLAILKDEVFGPVLHVVRFERRNLSALIGAINASGYGLTLGIHSRINETIDEVVQQAAVGNIYVNRNMVGAVVGSQPFGGRGLSGTGPKAGGPLYLFRLQQQQALQIPAQQIILPGPTGERNLLDIGPRGTVLCMASTAAALKEQVTAALSTANLILLRHADLALLTPLLTAAERLHVTACAESELDSRAMHAALIDESLVKYWRYRIALRQGLLVPVITTSPGAPIPSLRLVTEKSISINTTAAGGNTALMGAET